MVREDGFMGFVGDVKQRLEGNQRAHYGIREVSFGFVGF